jgi:predicted nucleic acid-binding protein
VIVVDTNVITYLILQREKTDQAQSLYRKDSDWVMPTLWRHEYLNVLANYVRHGGVEYGDVEKAWNQAISCFGDKERHVDMLIALRLACVHNISAYDAQYIALAENLGVTCITEDQHL